MKPELKEALAGVRRAIIRLEKAEGRIAVRNARRALFGATRALDGRVTKLYPIPEKKPTARSGTLLRQAETLTTEQFESILARVAHESGFRWNLYEVQCWVNMQPPPTCGLAPLISVHRDISPCLHSAAGEMNFPHFLGRAGHRLAWVIHRMAHVDQIVRGYKHFGHGRDFNVKMLELYQSFGAQAWREEIDFGADDAMQNRDVHDEEQEDT